MLCCPIAASAPRIIEAIAIKTISDCQAGTSSANDVPMTRNSNAIAATFGAVAKKVVTGVGAPSYTSGVHIWNGTAEILNANPTTTNTTPTIRPGGAAAGVMSASCNA